MWTCDAAAPSPQWQAPESPLTEFFGTDGRQTFGEIGSRFRTSKTAATGACAQLSTDAVCGESQAGVAPDLAGTVVPKHLDRDTLTNVTGLLRAEQTEQ